MKTTRRQDMNKRAREKNYHKINMFLEYYSFRFSRFKLIKNLDQSRRR